MDERGQYHSTFHEEPHTPLEVAAWNLAYTEFLAERPDRPGWAEKKADDEWPKYL